MLATLRAFTLHGPSWTVGLAFMTLNFLFGSWLARLPEVQNRLQLTDGQLGLGLLGLSLGSLFVTPFTGWLLSHLPAGRATLIGLLSFCTALPLAAFAPNLMLLIAALILVGIANGFLNVSMNAAAAGVEQEFQRSIMSTCHGMFSLGGMLGAASAGWLATLGLPLSLHLTGLAALLILANLTFAPILLRLADFRRPAGKMRLRLPGKAVALFALLGFCFILAEGVVGDWSAVYLRNVLGSDAFLAGMGFAGYSFAMAIGRFSGDALLLRFGARTLVSGGGLLGAAGMLLAVFSPDPLLAISGFTLVGLGLSTVVPLLFSAAARAPGMTAGSGIASVATAGMIGFLLGRPGFGLVSQYFGMATGLGLVALVLAFAGLFARRIKW